MIYAVLNSDGTYTGAAYAALSPEITEYHAQFDQALVPVDRLTLDASDGSWGAVALSNDDLARCVRAQRDALLTACDWTQVADAPLTDDQKSVWVVYRQALRDVTAQAMFPTVVDWPAAPS